MSEMFTVHDIKWHYKVILPKEAVKKISMVSNTNNNISSKCNELRIFANYSFQHLSPSKQSSKKWFLFTIDVVIGRGWGSGELLIMFKWWIVHLVSVLVTSLNYRTVLLSHTDQTVLLLSFWMMLNSLQEMKMNHNVKLRWRHTTSLTWKSYLNFI